MDKGSRMQPKDYVEEWYQKMITPQYSLILQEILMANRNVKSILHIITNNQVFFSCLDMSISKILIHKWLHWKHEYIYIYIYIYIGKIKINFYSF